MPKETKKRAQVQNIFDFKPDGSQRWFTKGLRFSRCCCIIEINVLVCPKNAINALWTRKPK